MGRKKKDDDAAFAAAQKTLKDYAAGQRLSKLASGARSGDESAVEKAVDNIRRHGDDDDE